MYIQVVFFFNFRYISQRLENPELNLSEENIRNRNRRNIINLHMTIISWSLEFISGGITMCYYLLSIDGKDSGWTMLMPLEMFLYSILISGSYLLRSESVKETIISKGWFAPFIYFFQTIFEYLIFVDSCCCSPTVTLVEEIDMLEMPNANPMRHSVHPSIPTISGRIDDDLVIEDM